MSTLAIPFDEWQLRFHEAMAAILRAKEAIKRQAGMIGVAKGLWSASRQLASLTDLYKVVRAVPNGTIDEAWIRENVRSVSELVDSIEGLLDTAKRGGLTNRTLTAASLASIRKHGEEIAEHLDVLRLSIDPEVEALISQGRQNFAEGRSIPLDSLREE